MIGHHELVDGLKITSVTTKACTAASYRCVCRPGGMSQATCKNANRTAPYEGFLVCRTELTFTLAPIIDAWFNFPVPKEIDPYDTTTAGVINSGQSSNDDARDLSTDAGQYPNEKQGRQGGSCRGSRKAAQSSFRYTDRHWSGSCAKKGVQLTIPYARMITNSCRSGTLTVRTGRSKR